MGYTIFSFLIGDTLWGFNNDTGKKGTGVDNRYGGYPPGGVINQGVVIEVGGEAQVRVGIPDTVSD